MKTNSWVEITIYEGKKRQVRRMFERLGHPVIRLKRTRVNGLILGDLPKGRYRYLTSEEIKKLKKEISNN
jgi:pseudouridine synthase